MSRKLLKHFFQQVLLATVLVTAIATPNSFALSSPEASISAASPTDNCALAIWVATAKYIYQDDPSLESIQEELLGTIRKGNIDEFSNGLKEAINLGKKKLPSHTPPAELKNIFDKVQNQYLGSDYAALSEAIIKQLEKNKVRIKSTDRNSELKKLHQRLLDLANGKASATAVLNVDGSKPTSASDDSKAPVSAPAGGASTTDTTQSTRPSPGTGAASTGPEATNQQSDNGGLIQWLALGLAGLSMAGVIWLITKQPRVLVPAVPTPNHDQSRTKPNASDITWNEMTKYVQREFEKRQPPQSTISVVASSMIVPPVTEIPSSLPVAPPLPVPRLRRQYVNEAPFNKSFRAHTLTDQPGTYSIFVVESNEQQPNQGTFTVTGNLASHVSDHRNALEPVCEYTGNYPFGSETRIVTERPGAVRRSGDDWVVISEARIRFEG